MKTFISIQFFLFIACMLACRSPHDERFGVEEPVEKLNAEADSRSFVKQTYPEYVADRLYFKDVSVDSSGLVEWTLRQPSKINTRFEIEEFRWNKYMTLGTLDSTETGTTFSFQADTACGLYEIRILAIDYGEHYSQTVAYPDPAEVKFVGCFPKVAYPFNRRTKYELYNRYGDVVAKGCDTKLYFDQLMRGTYYVNYGNNMGKILVKGNKNVPICNLDLLSRLDSIIETESELMTQDVAIFFMNMGTECLNNVEFSQMNNELMFKILGKETKKFIWMLSENIDRKDVLDMVMTELESPIDDGIDLQEILAQIENLKVSDTLTKQLVLEAVEKGVEKSM